MMRLFLLKTRARHEHFCPLFLGSAEIRSTAKKARRWLAIWRGERRDS